MIQGHDKLKNAAQILQFAKIVNDFISNYVELLSDNDEF